MHADKATKQAEKDYLRRSGSRAWEEVKPFSPAGTQTLGESVRLIHDFAVAAHALDLLPGHRVLDLGVGAGWTTEWLRRLNVDVVAVDIAHDMLAVGKRRIPAPSFLVTGDLEALPFRAGTFDRALCLNALHHSLTLPPRCAKSLACSMSAAGWCSLNRAPGIPSGKPPGRLSNSLVSSKGSFRRKI